MMAYVLVVLVQLRGIEQNSISSSKRMMQEATRDRHAPMPLWLPERVTNGNVAIDDASHVTLLITTMDFLARCIVQRLLQMDLRSKTVAFDEKYTD
jgi:hypothetical protein